MDGSLCQWLQLHGKELGAGEDGEEILGNSFHKSLEERPSHLPTKGRGHLLKTDGIWKKLNIFLSIFFC